MCCNRHYVAVRRTPFKTISWLSLHFINRTIFQLVLQLTEFTWNKNDQRIAWVQPSLTFIFLKLFTANLLKILKKQGFKSGCVKTERQQRRITRNSKTGQNEGYWGLFTHATNQGSHLWVDDKNIPLNLRLTTCWADQLSTASRKISHRWTVIWPVKTSCRQTSLHPGLSTSWCVLACSGWPAFTGFRTTLSPITTCNQTEQRGEPWKLAHLELPKKQTTGWMMADSFFILSLAEIPGPFRTAAAPKRPRPATPGIPSPQHHPHHHRRHLPDLKWVINANSLASGCPVAGLGDPPKASDAALFTPPTPPPSHLTALGPRTKADFSGLHPPKTHSVCFLSSLNVTPQAPERIC